MFSSRKIFLIEDWFDYAMVTANLKYTKKNNNNNPVMRSKSLSNEKKPTHKKRQNKTKLTKKTKKTKKQKTNKHKNKIKMQLQQQQRHQCIFHGIRESYKT